MTATRDTANPLLRELERVHDTLRRDLRTCRDLADAALAGVPTAHLRDALDQLGDRSPLFQLKVNCLRYCELVHAHHGAEDASLFPAVRASAPELGAVIDRLEADHRLVSDLLDQVEVAAAQLDDVETATARQLLADTLAALSRHLLEHLDVEEEALAPVFMTWQSWPPNDLPPSTDDIRKVS
jgi:hemerythrin superfamily protein